MDDVSVGKVTIGLSVNLKKIHFPKISEQAPLTYYTLSKFENRRDVMRI